MMVSPFSFLGPALQTTRRSPGAPLPAWFDSFTAEMYNCIFFSHSWLLRLGFCFDVELLGFSLLSLFQPHSPSFISVGFGAFFFSFFAFTFFFLHFSSWRKSRFPVFWGKGAPTLGFRTLWMKQSFAEAVTPPPPCAICSASLDTGLTCPSPHPTLSCPAVSPLPWGGQPAWLQGGRGL